MAENFERKLTAILHADVAGYSRLTGQDEEGTHRVLRQYLPLIAEKIEGHKGRVVHYAGDAVLAEFATVSDAVQCAVAAQQELHRRNAELDEAQRVPFRMGVNLGEVIVDPPEIYGEGVNVAARLESIADVGGIAVSESVQMTVGHLLDLGFESMGEHEMKNIARPVHVYRVIFDGLPRTASAAADAPASQSNGDSTGEGAAVSDEPSSAGSRSQASIIVLPFTSLGKGEDEDWLAEGITEDLTIELSRFKTLAVIARNTAVTYAGKRVDARALNAELEVDYVLEGNIRRGGARCRIAVTLTDAHSGGQVWAEKYDHTLEDVFEVQDQITQTLAGVLPMRLEVAAAERARKKPTEKLEAYELLLRGRIHHHRSTAEDNRAAQQFLAKAIEIDPDLAQAHAWKACVLGQACSRGFSDDLEGDWATMIESAERSHALGSDDSECYRVSAEISLQKREFDQAESNHDRAFQLNPNDPRILSQRGELAIWRGRPAESIEWIEQAMRLDPRDADRRAGTKGLALLMMGKADEALPLVKKNPRPSAWEYALSAATFAAANDAECAERATKNALAQVPTLTASMLAEKLPFERDEDRERVRGWLLEAGLPE
jgi:adenylate cyclase